MAFAADITGSLAGLIPAQQAIVPGLAAPVAPRPARRIDKRGDSLTAQMTPAGDLLPFALIREAVQECLQDAVFDNAGALYALMADDEIVQLLHRLLGRPGDEETVGHSLQELVDSFSALAAKDGQPADVVRAIGRFTDKLKQTTAQLTRLRQQAAEQLQQGVKKANELLAKIADTNRQIMLSSASGAAMVAAGTTQQAHLAELAKSIDFSSFHREDGSVAVFTKQGVTLARDEAVQLVATDQGLQADGIDIAAQLSKGAVHAWLHNRDIALPNVQSQLDTLAQTLQSRVNQLTNRAVGGADARAVYRGRSSFSDPAGQRIGLTGGDAELALLREDGGALARISLSLAIKHYRRAHHLPVSGPWPIGQVAAAIADWIGQALPGAGNCAALSKDGQLQIDLPSDRKLRLAIRDSRSLALQSRFFPSADAPLGLQGQLTLSDGLGNEFSTAARRGGTPLSPLDNLRQVAAKLERIEGLSARLLSGEQGMALVIESQAASDLAAEPDSSHDNAALLLAAAPAEDQPQEDVAVSLVSATAQNQFGSRLFPSPSVSLGLQGSLILRDLDGAMLAFQTLQPDWSLERLVERLQNASDPRLTASIAGSGNQFALRIAALAAEDRFVIEGLPEGWQTSPRFDFAASGGEMAIGLGGHKLGSLAIAAGSRLAEIVQRIGEEDGPLARAGLRAQLLRAGNAEILDIAHQGGLPLTFEGSAIGPAPGQLDPRYNLRDQLRLAGRAERVVPGLANFFGLNDLFVAEPAGAFDGKAAIGIFTTTAMPGTAAALALNPGMAADPVLIGVAATIRQISDLLCNPLSIAQAGDLPKGSYRLTHYADAILQKVQGAARDNKIQLTYHQALLDRLRQEKADEINVDHRLAALMTLQRTYHDATELVAGLSRLTEQLRAPVH